MFVFTAKKKNLLRFILAVFLIFMVIFILICFLSRKDAVSVFSRSTAVSTKEDRLNFLSSFGWEIDEASEKSQNILIPRTFSRVYEDYNELQKTQGCDLSEYAGLEAVRYTYTVLNYPDYSGTVYAELLVHSNIVIGGDVHAAAMDGFICGLSFPS